MMDDTFESLEDDDLEEEAGEAVEAILFEVTKGEILGMRQTAPSVVSVCVDWEVRPNPPSAASLHSSLHSSLHPSLHPSLHSSLHPFTPRLGCRSSSQVNLARLLLSLSSQRG